MPAKFKSMIAMVFETTSALPNADWSGSSVPTHLLCVRTHTPSRVLVLHQPEFRPIRTPTLKVVMVIWVAAGLGSIGGSVSGALFAW